MEKINKEKIKIATENILLSLLESSVNIFKTGYKLYPATYCDLNNLQNNINIEMRDLQKKLSRLKRKEYIQKYKKNKKILIKLTPIGKKKALKYALKNYTIKSPKKWDKKWRMVIFDIPEKKQNIRKAIRMKLKNTGFYQLQKSVWVHPFECKELIYSLKYVFCINSYLQYVIAESIETEINLVKLFYDKKILTKKLI